MNRKKEIKGVIKTFYYNNITPKTMKIEDDEWLDCENFRNELGYSTIEEMFDVVVAKDKLRLATYEN